MTIRIKLNIAVSASFHNVNNSRALTKFCRNRCYTCINDIKQTENICIKHNRQQQQKQQQTNKQQQKSSVSGRYVDKPVLHGMRIYFNRIWKKKYQKDY